jgi:hypothetical protein
MNKKDSFRDNVRQHDTPKNPYRQPGERPYQPDVPPVPYFPEPIKPPVTPPVTPVTPPVTPVTPPVTPVTPPVPYFPEPIKPPVTPPVTPVTPPVLAPPSTLPAWKKGLLLAAGVTLITVGVIGTAALAANNVTGIGVADDVLIPATVGLVVLGSSLINKDGGGT